MKLLLPWLLLAAGCPGLFAAESMRLIVQPNGEGGFVLTGENVIGVQTLNVDIDYDSGMLAHPNVMANGGDIRQIKDDVPGKLSLSIFRPDADPNLQIFVYFAEARQENTTGGLYHVSATVTGTTAWPSKPDTDPPPDTFSDEPPVNPGEVAPVVVPVPEKGRAAAPAARKIDPAPVAATAVSPQDAGRQARSEKITLLTREEKSVLQRFKKYQGEKDLGSFAALFGRSEGERFTQEPAIAISDGKTPVMVRLDARLPEDARPAGLALSDALLLSKKVNAQDIVMTVLPHEGTWDARLVIETNQGILDYPLVVAPRIGVGTGRDKKDFSAALAAYIAAQPEPQRRDKAYLYEYIFTANYLADAAGGREKASRQ